jgi:hypothetical protein
MKPNEMAKAIEDLLEKQAELEGRVAALEEQTGSRGRGPKVERSMTEADAYRVKYGDHKPPMSHKLAAESLGLSYGQVFSCRGGYTFKRVNKPGTMNDDGTPLAKEEAK